MTGFILKDLLTLRKYLRTFALFIVFFAVMSFYLDDASFMSATVAILFAMLPVTSFSYDQHARWEWFAQTLPATKRDIVAGKYVLSIAFAALGTILGNALTLVSGLLKDTPFHPRDLALASGFFFAAGIFFLSVMIPLIYKFGVEKTRLLLLMVVSTTMLLGVLMKQPVMGFLAEASPGVVPGLALIGAAALMAVSFFISKAIYESRDL